MAVTYALTHPARVERLALVAALVPGFSFRMSLGHRLIALPVIGEALALCGRASGLQGRASPAASTSIARAEVDFLVEHDYATRTSPEARAAWLATARHIRSDFVDHRADYRRAIATLDLPVLLVHGRQDPAVSRRARGRGGRRLPARRPALGRRLRPLPAARARRRR